MEIDRFSLVTHRYLIPNLKLNAFRLKESIERADLLNCCIYFNLILENFEVFNNIEIIQRFNGKSMFFEKKK